MGAVVATKGATRLIKSGGGRKRRSSCRSRRASFFKDTEKKGGRKREIKKSWSKRAINTGKKRQKPPQLVKLVQ